MRIKFKLRQSVWARECGRGNMQFQISNFGFRISDCGLMVKFVLTIKLKMDIYLINPPQADQYSTTPLLHDRGQNASLK